jgi:hypothetical protein
LNGVTRALSDLDESLGATIHTREDLTDEDAEYLVQLTGVLSPPREPLSACVTLAPKLADLLELSPDDARSRVATLTEEEAELLEQLENENHVVPASARRACLDVAALRWLIHEDLTVWEALGAGEPADEDESRTTKVEAHSRLQSDEAVYRFVNSRLQKHLDAAIKAREPEAAERIDRFRRSLFSSYLKLAPVLRDVPEGSEPPATAQGAPTAPDEGPGPGGDAVTGNGEYEEVFEEAVTDLRRSPRRSASKKARHHERRSIRLRMAVLVCAFALLAGSAVLVHHMLPVEAPPRIKVSAVEFSDVLRLTEAQPIGTLLYARASIDWNGLTDQERISRVGRIGKLAAERGFDRVYLVDSDAEPAAEWSQSSGATLILPQP